jgi:hypothetical protein
MTKEPSNLDLAREAATLLSNIKREHALVISAAEESNDLWTANAISNLKDATHRLSEILSTLISRSAGEWATDLLQHQMSKEFPNWPHPGAHPYR